MNEFCIHVYLDVSEDYKYKSSNRLFNIIFEPAKNSVGCVFSQNSKHEIFGCGKHTDAVRVYAALKNNGYKIVYCEGV